MHSQNSRIPCFLTSKYLLIHICASLFASAERKARRRSVSSRTLPRCLLVRRCCIPPLRCPKEVFPSPGRTWTSSWIFRDGVLPPRFSPRSFLADRRTPASSQWHEPASKTARPTKFRFYAIYVNAKTNVVGNILVYSPSYTLSQMWYGDNGGLKKEIVSRRQNRKIAYCFASAVFPKNIYHKTKI